ncbi:hypothetical protein [Leptolyngbya sp. FACHB-261]|uniref:hypothetical protein n=1 Tax=Leptolyngbya sp. FACHB-261 TaxID=2692806 RepID=UPI00168953F5|nr:hypothetical protein [Leptolyngbya sp. FACHB-261]MBD2102041.1 hypothetical protein [Leptolyngbya sp. FACHB-261]
MTGRGWYWDGCKLGMLLALGWASTSSVLAQVTPSRVASITYTPSLDRNRFSTAELVALDADVTVAADAETRLRLYEIQVSKMVETTRFLCEPQGPAPLPGPGVDWTYRASNRSLIGRFRLSCSVVNDLSQAYGLLPPEATSININRTVQNYSIPVLRVAGPGKVSRFINWVWSLPRLA